MQPEPAAPKRQRRTGYSIEMPEGPSVEAGLRLLWGRVGRKGFMGRLVEKGWWEEVMHEDWIELRPNLDEGRGDVDGFDPVIARRAVEDFAEHLRSIEMDHPEAIERLRVWWELAYRACGHKALGRYLLTGDVDKACGGFERKTARVSR